MAEYSSLTLATVPWVDQEIVWAKPLAQTELLPGEIIVKPANTLNVDAEVLVKVESALLETCTNAWVEGVEGVTHDKGLVALVDKVTQI